MLRRHGVISGVATKAEGQRALKALSNVKDVVGPRSTIFVSLLYRSNVTMRHATRSEKRAVKLLGWDVAKWSRYILGSI